MKRKTAGLREVQIGLKSSFFVISNMGQNYKDGVIWGQKLMGGALFYVVNYLTNYSEIRITHF